MFIVFDLDGTLALIEHRRHFVQNGNHMWAEFYEACDQDEPNNPVISILKTLRLYHHIEIWSGRSEAVRGKTEAWLARYGIIDVTLRMRKEGDYTPDEQLKKRWLDEAMAERCTIDLVFDDRDKVVAMWRKNGIVCAQVAPGDF